jgi:hypothetical protein
MDNLFNAQVCFNGGNFYLFKVQDDVMLTDLNDQLNEINHRLNPGDTRRVEDVQHGCRSSLQSDKIMLTSDDCVRSMFSVFHQHNMFLRNEMDATLLRSLEYTMNRLILPQDYVYVAPLLWSVFNLLEFKFNYC